MDNLKTRKVIHESLKHEKARRGYSDTFYWIDCGNAKDHGQIIMAAYDVDSPLPSIIDLHPNIKEKKGEPSCSVRRSLMEQSFMINKITGVFAVQMLSSLLMDYNINYNEVYFNLANMNVKTNKL